MKSGTKPVRKDHRTYSYHRTFGAAVPVYIDYDLDAKFGFPDQEADGLPNGCTGYTQSELCQDEDLRQYKPRFTYDKTQNIEGVFSGDATWETQGCDITDSLKSTLVYGVQGLNEATDMEAFQFRRGAYYDVLNSSGMDAFDSVIAAMQASKRSISVGTPWFPEWEKTLVGGVLPMPVYSGNPSDYPWHNSKICGVKLIDGTPYLIDKSWQGSSFGDGGYVYFNRATFNGIMGIDGTCAFTVARYTQGDTQTVVLSLYETVISYLQMYLSMLTH